MRANRGDLVAIVTKRRDWYGNEGVRERTEVELEEVTGITRDGIVRMTRALAWGDDQKPTELKRRLGLETWLIVPADRIDKAKAAEIVRAHTYPNSTTPKAYESVQALRSALAPAYRQLVP